MFVRKEGKSRLLESANNISMPFFFHAFPALFRSKADKNESILVSVIIIEFVSKAM